MTKTNKFFETKEQYLAFRAAFAAAQNNPRAKKGKPQPPHGIRDKGWLSGAHFMLLNAVRGLPYDRGFTPITCQRKLDNGAIPDAAIASARRLLEGQIYMAKEYLNPKPAERSNRWRFGIGRTASQEEADNRKMEYLLKDLKVFLAPFDDTFSINDLANVDIDGVEDSE